ncbi:MAG: hypothetical protein LKF74_08235 [Megasphaera sp.]|jgi:hypothetical protein|nr:hypothetical protein [Megasphaera sp.]MCH4218527.1 hypothetical protein [Megasphaera sp.]
MKKIILTIIALALSISCSFAHWLPESETFVGGVGYGCTLEYVKSIYGEPSNKRWFNTDGVRGVTYSYGPLFSVTGRTWDKDQKPEGELTVTGYTLKANNLATPSGLTVGIPYETVANMYGSVPKWTSHDGRTGYIYEFNHLREMIFYVNSNGIINEIVFGTDW